MEVSFKEMAEMVEEMIESDTFDKRALVVMFQASAYKGILEEQAKQNLEKRISRLEAKVSDMANQNVTLRNKFAIALDEAK